MARSEDANVAAEELVGVDAEAHLDVRLAHPAEVGGAKVLRAVAVAAGGAVAGALPGIGLDGRDGVVEAPAEGVVQVAPRRADGGVPGRPWMAWVCSISSASRRSAPRSGSRATARWGTWAGGSGRRAPPNRPSTAPGRGRRVEAAGRRRGSRRTKCAMNASLKKVCRGSPVTLFLSKTSIMPKLPKVRTSRRLLTVLPSWSGFESRADRRRRGSTSAGRRSAPGRRWA